ncbi:MAG: NADAR family protein [Bacteroidota bacterium]
MTYSIAWLLNQLAEGHRVKYLFFWGHTPKSEQGVDKSCFSQWFARAFEHGGVTYFTAEHWMMAEKARLFEDQEALTEILKADHPAKAKNWGRKVKGFDQQTWEAHRFEIVVQGNVLKFGQHEDLCTFLLQSGERVLVEASPRDRIWGIGMGQNNPAVEHPEQWRGRNLLGFALMEARDQIIQKT